MQQAHDFLTECEELDSMISSLQSDDFENVTQFKNWTVNDILVHLHFWDAGADLSLNEPDEFTIMFDQLYAALKAGKLRGHENKKVKVRGSELASVWREKYRDMAKRWSKIDPKHRVKWAGPDMSARTSISARQMEYWAHGQAIFDLFGKDRNESDRIRNVVVLGVNAFGWSHKVHGFDIPTTMPKLTLSAPSGDQWIYGEDGENLIDGSAVEFCQVVTQTRNILDTQLVVKGAVAEKWMAYAQCFAGRPEIPPAPGTRFKQ
ncbi:MAG: TIGR03084 family metal-binding protein [Pseudomonadota bacterium]